MFSSHACRRPAHPFRKLTLEILEDRCLLSYVVTDLGTLGGLTSWAYGINNASQVVGEASTGTTSEDGMQDLGTVDCGGMGTGYGTASAINNLNQIVGYNGCISFQGGVIHDVSYAAIWDPDNGWQNLNDLIPPDSGWNLAAATGINDLGQIVGYGLIQDYLHGFLLDPAADSASRSRFHAAVSIAEAAGFSPQDPSFHCLGPTWGAIEQSYPPQQYAGRDADRVLSQLEATPFFVPPPRNPLQMPDGG